MYLSFPPGNSVNDSMPKNVYQGKEMPYTLPTAIDLIEMTLRNGQLSYIWKAALKRAYRRIGADPLDYPLMEMIHEEKHFIDVCPAFRCRSASASAVQYSVSLALVYMMRKRGHEVLAYVNETCQDLGMKVAP